MKKHLALLLGGISAIASYADTPCSRYEAEVVMGHSNLVVQGLDITEHTGPKKQLYKVRWSVNMNMGHLVISAALARDLREYAEYLNPCEDPAMPNEDERQHNLNGLAAAILSLDYNQDGTLDSRDFSRHNAKYAESRDRHFSRDR